jgi:hypothetical protein
MLQHVFSTKNTTPSTRLNMKSYNYFKSAPTPYSWNFSSNPANIYKIIVDNNLFGSMNNSESENPPVVTVTLGDGKTVRL